MGTFDMTKIKVREKFSRYDTADYLETEADIAAYLTACADEDNPALFVAALGDVARARNITQLAEKTGMTRMGLYKALSGQGNPSFATVSKVAHALGLKITVAASSESHRLTKGKFQAPSLEELNEADDEIAKSFHGTD